MLLFNGCGAVEHDIASDVYSIEHFGLVDLRQQ